MVENVAIEDWQPVSELDPAVSWLDFGDLASDIFEGLGDFIGNVLEAISFLE